MILLSLFVSAGIFAANAAITEKNFTAEQLQGTANYLSLRMEKPKTKILKCDPDPAAAKTWMGGALHSLIDEKVKAEVEHYLNNPSQMVKRVSHCSRACACSLYEAMLTGSEDTMGKHRTFKEIKAALAKESKKEDSMACAKKLTWFCGSELESFLRGTPLEQKSSLPAETE